jgi:hypothetical protein
MQRKDTIFLTVNVPNVRPDASYKLSDEGHLTLNCTGGNLGSEHEYTLDIDLLKPIQANESKVKVNARNVVMRIVKATPGPYWERLLREKAKNVHCTIDWDNWKDEDEEDDDDHAFGSHFADNKDFQDMDFGSGGSSDDDDDDAADTAGIDAKDEEK